MEQGRRLAFGVVGIGVMFVAAGIGLRAIGGGDTRIRATSSSSIDRTQDGGTLPTEPEVDALGPPVGTDLPVTVATEATLPVPLPASVATIPLPGPGTGSTPTSTAGSAFSAPGVWVVKADGSRPTLVARNATAGVAAGGTWVAFVQGGTLKAAPRSDLLAPRDLALGVGGTAASGLPISGGKRGVAFLQGGKAVLVDPASPAQPLVAHDAPGADAVAAEVDGEGRLAWADANGLHVGAPESATAEDVQRGMLVLGHGTLASLQGGQVTIRNGPVLAWGEVDRLWVGPTGLVAGSAGRIHLRTAAGVERLLLDRASTPVLTATRILYVSSGGALASASLTGTGPAVVARAGPGRAITNLDLLDDATLVVTVS